MIATWTCTGFTTNAINEHLRGEVGNARQMMDWVRIAYPSKSLTELCNFFDEFSDKEIAEYLHKNMKIKLEKTI